VEYDTIEAFAKRFNASFRAGDAPVEAALLFHRKIQDFLQQFVTSDNGIFGKVQLLVDRYEVQGRDAPHAHLVLWIDKEDHARVRDEIVACVPAEFDATTQTWIPPSDPLQMRLLNCVLRKQMHTCDPKRCQHKGVCKRGFPFPVNTNGTTLNNASKRYEYHRPRHEDRNVVPYHPTARF
jgi:hypothetical protein